MILMVYFFLRFALLQNSSSPTRGRGSWLFPGMPLQQCLHKCHPSFPLVGLSIVLPPAVSLCFEWLGCLSVQVPHSGGFTNFSLLKFYHMFLKKFLCQSCNTVLIFTLITLNSFEFLWVLVFGLSAGRLVSGATCFSSATSSFGSLFSQELGMLSGTLSVGTCRWLSYSCSPLGRILIHSWWRAQVPIYQVPMLSEQQTP